MARKQRLTIERLSYEDIRHTPGRFLARYHSAGTLPVPIEDIVDLDFKTDIIPLPGLLDSFDVDAFLTNDMESLYVDNFIYTSRPGRFRFSLGHEIGHAVLHQRIYRELSFGSIEGFKRMQDSINEEDYGWMEWQAQSFSGLILVPATDLEAHVRDWAIKVCAATKLAVADLSDAARMMITKHVAVAFDVSPGVIEQGLRYDDLWGRLQTAGP